MVMRPEKAANLYTIITPNLWFYVSSHFTSNYPHLSTKLWDLKWRVDPYPWLFIRMVIIFTPSEAGIYTYFTHSSLHLWYFISSTKFNTATQQWLRLLLLSTDYQLTKTKSVSVPINAVARYTALMTTLLMPVLFDTLPAHTGVCKYQHLGRVLMSNYSKQLRSCINSRDKYP